MKDWLKVLVLLLDEAVLEKLRKLPE